jgi:DNA-binding winged helix-turn-helix (wHTH) protein
MSGLSSTPKKRVRFADFELDFGRFQLLRCGRPLRVEGLPLQLLMFLIENPQRLVTRAQVAQTLWGPDVFVDVEQGINTAVRKIRIVLEDDSAQPRYLQTVVGRGYRWVAPLCEEGGETPATAKAFNISAEEFGLAVMAAAGLSPNKFEARRKARATVLTRPGKRTRLDIPSLNS